VASCVRFGDTLLYDPLTPAPLPHGGEGRGVCGRGSIILVPYLSFPATSFLNSGKTAKDVLTLASLSPRWRIFSGSR